MPALPKTGRMPALPIEEIRKNHRGNSWFPLDLDQDVGEGDAHFV